MEIFQPRLCISTNGFSLAEDGAHGDLVDGCAQGVVIGVGDADRAAGFVLLEHQYLVRLAVGNQIWRVGSDQHLLRKFTRAGQALTQSADEVGAPVWIEMGFRLVEQEKAVGVAEQQAQAQTVQQLMFAVRQLLEHYRFSQALFGEAHELIGAKLPAMVAAP